MLLYSEIITKDTETIIIEKTPSHMILSAIIDGERVSMKYIGYTKQQAVKLFKEYLGKHTPHH
jgi:hypothetical protein